MADNISSVGTGSVSFNEPKPDHQPQAEVQKSTAEIALFKPNENAFQEKSVVNRGDFLKAQIQNQAAKVEIPRMDAASEKELAKLNPQLADRIRLTAADLKKQGIEVVVAPKGGFRTFAEQNALYAQGRTQPGKIVTNARGGESYHNYGLAVDLVPTVNGRPTWNAPAKTWEAMGRAGEKQGLEWGGRWKGLVDTPHFQLVGNTKNASDLLPTFNQGGVAAVWEKINKQYPNVGGTTPTTPTQPPVSGNGLKINDVPNYRQGAAPWGSEPYRLSPNLGNFAGNGCTVTAAAIAAQWATGKAVTPHDANSNWGATIGKFEYKNLGPGGKVPFGDTFSPVGKNSATGEALLDTIKDSIKSGHPVVLGISGNVTTPDGANWSRHTVVATGISEKGEVLVNDPATGKTQPLSAFKFNNFDMAQRLSKPGGAGGTVSGNTNPTPTVPTPPTTPTAPGQTLPIPTARLQQGDAGSQVKQLQDALFKLGYKALDPAKIGGGHGVFGPITDRSLRDFQAKHGLVADGIYGPQTRAALTKALGGAQAPTPTAPTAPTAPLNANLSRQAANINNILRGTGLAGQGETIARLAQKYNIPPEFAIAMFRKEASFAAPGTLAARNNNPGNLRFANQDGAVSGARGFAQWKTMGEGIEGFFKLMNKQPYRGWLDNKDYHSVIFRYAPPSENNSELYVKEITGWISGYRNRINGN